MLVSFNSIKACTCAHWSHRLGPLWEPSVLSRCISSVVCCGRPEKLIRSALRDASKSVLDFFQRRLNLSRAHYVTTQATLWPTLLPEFAETFFHKNSIGFEGCGPQHVDAQKRGQKPPFESAFYLGSVWVCVVLVMISFTRKHWHWKVKALIFNDYQRLLMRIE